MKRFFKYVLLLIFVFTFSFACDNKLDSDDPVTTLQWTRSDGENITLTNIKWISNEITNQE